MTLTREDIEKLAADRAALLVALKVFMENLSRFPESPVKSFWRDFYCPRAAIAAAEADTTKQSAEAK